MHARDGVLYFSFGYIVNVSPIRSLLPFSNLQTHSGKHSIPHRDTLLTYGPKRIVIATFNAILFGNGVVMMLASANHSFIEFIHIVGQQDPGVVPAAF